MSNAILALVDGTIVEGKGFGAEKTALGELVFATSITGYEEALTDPSYKGQILMLTYPLIGNYGVSGSKFQSEGIKAEGFIVREMCDHPSHYRSVMTIDEFLRREGIPGMHDVDTRMLTIKTRRYGTMKACLMVKNGAITKYDRDKALELAVKQPDISEMDLVEKVTCSHPYVIKGREDSPKIAFIDLGVKRNILRSLEKRGFHIFVFPSSSGIEEIESVEPDALFLSNGPGDPIRAENAIDITKRFIGRKPVFGICLGHQIVALSLGARTYKLKFGHRGANHPVKDIERSKVFITSQNHGFAVDHSSLEAIEGTKVTELNANDNTVEGFYNEYLGIKCVQYHPEASPGPLDTENIFFSEVVRTLKKFK